MPISTFVAGEQYFAQQGLQFYNQRVKRTAFLYFQFFVVWTRSIDRGRVHLQAEFALEFGIYLDSNLVSRIMEDLFLNLASQKTNPKLGTSVPSYSAKY
ncbi:MAG: hypothetical protein IH840_08710 [Candidatus Heimdallarchaeota archaeon]|nr:hypothetical protein [Candidatus Heimdallarchaeota archaeon]